MNTMISFTVEVCVWDTLYTYNGICSYLHSCLVSGYTNMQRMLAFFALLVCLSFSEADCQKHFVIA